MLIYHALRLRESTKNSGSLNQAGLFHVEGYTISVHTFAARNQDNAFSVVSRLLLPFESGGFAIKPLSAPISLDYHKPVYNKRLT